MEHLARELLYGAIRTAIQIGAAVVGWFLWAEFGVIGGTIAALLVFLVFIALEIVRAKRFRRLFAERLGWIREEKFRRGYLPFILLTVILFGILFPLELFMRMDFKRPMYVLIVATSLWDEAWLAHRRYRMD